MKPGIKILLACACGLMSAYAEAQVLTLDSIIHTIKKQNPVLQVYRHRTSAMYEYAQGATAQMAPEAGGGLWMFPYSKPTDMRDRGQIMISVQQKFTNTAKLKANKEYLSSKADVERANEDYAFNELRASARLNYYQWIVLEKKKKIIREDEEIVTLMLKLARIRYPYNQGKIGEIYKAEARLAEIQNMNIMNENQIALKNIALNQLMKLPNTTVFQVDTTWNIKPDLIEGLDTTTIVRNRSDIRGLENSIRSLRLGQVAERKQTKPDFTLSFNHMIPRSPEMPSQFMLLGMVSIPIAPWSSKMYKANLKGMEMEIYSMQQEKISIINETQAMASSMHAEIKALQKQLDNYKEKIIPALRQNYQTLMLAYEENREELPRVLNGWEALNMARTEYLNKLESYYTLIVNYEKQIEQ